MTLKRSLLFSTFLLQIVPWSTSFAPKPVTVVNTRTGTCSGSYNLQLFSTTSLKEDQDFRINTTPPQTQPAAAHTFAGQVEQALIAKYGQEDASRVLESWRLLDAEYEHRQYVGGGEIDEASSLNYQHAHSYVPGLTSKPFWDVETVPWAKKLAKEYKTIRKEFLDVTSNMEKLKAEGNNVWEGALTQEAGGYGEGWSTLVLMDRGIWEETNCNLFPKTAKSVKKSGIPAAEVFFASMKPNSSIKLHSDFTNFVLTSHLAVDIPENGNNKCRLSIGDETKEWINGEVMLFDTSIMHDAVNESDQTRYILMFRVWHPDLTDAERGALQMIYDYLEVPELLSSDETVRKGAEIMVEQMRAFPKLKVDTGGFGGGGKANNKKKKKGKR